MAGTHNTFLVILSVLVAIFASYTALDIWSRVRASQGWVRLTWLSAAALSLGGGIWSMHFVAMLAFSIPGMSAGYSLGLTAVSLAVAVVFTGAGFAIVGRRPRPSLPLIVAAGLLMGSGVVTMHYLGMAAMRLPARLSYAWPWVGVSVLIALGAATAAVWLAAREKRASQRLAAAALMGAAIAGMHYSGMQAASFTPDPSFVPVQGHPALGQAYLAITISAITTLILLLALGAAYLQRLFAQIARREERTALRLKVSDILRTGSTLEALHEIAALMGTHFDASRTGYGELDPQEDVFSYEVCWTNGLVTPLLGRFPASAFGVKIVAALKAGQTVVIDDLFDAPLSDEARTRETAREVDTRSILVVPFVREGRLRTIVYLNDRHPRRWQADDVAFMEELAERTRLVIEREAVEARLRELNATLEARVEARNRELQQTQAALLHSQKLEAMGQLVAGMAHDFNNVLGAVVGAFELIARRVDQPERVTQFAQAGREAALRGSKLTAQLLAFSRSQAIQLRPILVCDVIGEIGDLLSRTLGPMIPLSLRLNPEPVAVLADPTQVEMMVLNLAINARDAMPDGGELTIATQLRSLAGDPELADGDYVEISVADTGAGMDAETMQRAMEPFFTTKPLGKGTGLGLSQIYGSARQAGGSVRMESAVGVGTTVRVLLPCTDHRPPRPGADQAEIGLAAAAPLELLIIDDDPHHRSILASGLEGLGHRVSQAEDGPTGLALLESSSPDAILLDFAMPGMNGAEVARAVRGRWPGIAIIFTSGLADTQAIAAAVGQDAIILAKPFGLAQVQQVLSPLKGSAHPPPA